MPHIKVSTMIAFLEAQGSLLKMTVRGYKSNPSPFGAKRGKIRVFSAASRRRLMRFMARLKTRKIRATFITLTFSEEIDNVSAKKVLKRFIMRIRRRHPQASAVWRMEYQSRGAIHFHLLAFNLPFWKQQDLQATWEHCTGEVTSIVDIRLVNGARSVMAYVSKYIAKRDDGGASTSLDDGSYQHAARDDMSGRYWGWINKNSLPLGKDHQGVLSDRDTIKRLSHYIWRMLGNENTYNNLSFHYFTDNAIWLYERAIEQGGCELDEWEYTTKDHTTPKPTHSTYTEQFFEQDLKLISVPTIGKLIKGE